MSTRNLLFFILLPLFQSISVAQSGTPTNPAYGLLVVSALKDYKAVKVTVDKLADNKRIYRGTIAYDDKLRVKTTLPIVIQYSDGENLVLSFNGTNIDHGRKGLGTLVLDWVDGHVVVRRTVDSEETSMEKSALIPDTIFAKSKSSDNSSNESTENGDPAIPDNPTTEKPGSNKLSAQDIPENFDELIDVMIPLYARVLKESASARKDPSYSEDLAAFKWNYYQALLKAGFTEEQAFLLVRDESQEKTIWGR